MSISHVREIQEFYDSLEKTKKPLVKKIILYICGRSKKSYTSDDLRVLSKQELDFVTSIRGWYDSEHKNQGELSNLSFDL